MGFQVFARWQQMLHKPSNNKVIALPAFVAMIGNALMLPNLSKYQYAQKISKCLRN